MSSVSSRARRSAVRAVKESLRDLRNQLSLLNHQVSSAVRLKDVDLDCLELIQRAGPLGPSVLARTAGLHPATLTGILDRLQRGGWIVRERDPEAADRRAITVRALRDRNGELIRHYAGMNTAMDTICAGYSDAELQLLADFLRRVTAAGRDATAEMTTE
jgi:DNA-binding MarR family transcriptional regulator